MIMKRSPRESSHSERSTSRNNSPETKEDRLIIGPLSGSGANGFGNIGGGGYHDDQEAFVLATALAERNSLLSLANRHTTSLRGAALQGLSQQQQQALSAPGNNGNCASSFENQLQALSNQQLMRNRNSLQLQLLMGGPPSGLSSSNPFSASSSLFGNSTTSTGRNTPDTQALWEQVLRAPCHQQQRNQLLQQQRERSSGLPPSFPNSLSEMEHQQLQRLSQLQSSSLLSNAEMDLIRLSNMGALGGGGANPSPPPSARGMLLPSRAGSFTAAAGGPSPSSLGIPSLAGFGGASPHQGLRAEDHQLTHQLTPHPSALTTRDILAGRAAAASAVLSGANSPTPEDKSRKRKASPTPPPNNSNKPVRRRRSRDPVVIQGVPHHTERKSCSLGIDEDPNWLSEFQCFVRSELMEVIQASQSDVLVRSTSKSIQPNQVGVRCRYCAHLSPGSRVSRSSAFPSSLDKLYQSFSMMVRDHFGRCPEVPPDKAREFQALKGQNAQGATDSKQYWVYAAQKLGMVDAECGIERPEASQITAKQMPPYGAGEGAATEEEKPAPLVSVPDDSPRLTPFLYQLLQHLQLVHLLPSERVGKRKGLPVGLEGLGCKYCCEKGRLGFSRCFPLRRRALPSHMYDLYRHCRRCPLCPPEVKQLLQQAHDGTGGNNGNGGNHQARELDSYAIVWAKLGRQRDLTTS